MKIKRFIYASLMIAFSGTLSVSMTGCKKEANELAHNHSHHNHVGEEHEHEHGEGHVHGDEEQENKSGAHASDEIIIEPERASKLGVTTSKATPGEFFETVAVGGELSSAPSNQSTVTARSAGIVSLTPAATPGAHVAKGTILATISGKGMAGGDANEAARVALTAAKRELDRLTPLHADGIVSTRDYNAAKQAYEAAKAAAGNGSAGGSTAYSRCRRQFDTYPACKPPGTGSTVPANHQWCQIPHLLLRPGFRYSRIQWTTQLRCDNHCSHPGIYTRLFHPDQQRDTLGRILLRDISDRQQT